MATQTTAEVFHGVMRAYAFTVQHRDVVESYAVGAIARSLDEALANFQMRYKDFPHQPIFFNIAVAVMQPAMITRWEKGRKIEEKGHYAFLQGLFFSKYGEHQIVASCRKDKTLDGWAAIIYRDNHYTKPL